ncbi:hypothetical protein MMC10_009088 [Thelotrema lepadinum]|nr:hypothetical protein [Thelotrema lepadinum]
MAPLLNVALRPLTHRSASSLLTTTHTLSKRYIYYYNSSAAIAGIVIAVIFLLLSILSCWLRCKYGWSWYGRPSYSRGAYSYSAPYNNNTYGAYRGGYNPGVNDQQQRRWPGQTTAHFAAPSQLGGNATELNAHGHHKVANEAPPPMYTGPGTFYDGAAGGHGNQGASGHGGAYQNNYVS